MCGDYLVKIPGLDRPVLRHFAMDPQVGHRVEFEDGLFEIDQIIHRTDSVPPGNQTAEAFILLNPTDEY